MSDGIETPHCGFMALVSYVPEPLSSVLYRLRAGLPGLENPQPHITVLPRRPLFEPLEAASARALLVLESFSAFDVELCSLQHFPQTNVLYVDVGDGSRELNALHQALNTAELAHVEEFDFRPHITLGGPVAPGELTALAEDTERAWLAADVTRRFRLDEIACLWLRPGAPHGSWERVWSHRLTTHTTIRAASAGLTSRTS